MEGVPFVPTSKVSDRLHHTHGHPVSALVRYFSFPFPHGGELRQMEFRRSVEHGVSHQHAAKERATRTRAAENKDCRLAHRTLPERNHGLSDFRFVTECRPRCEVARQCAWRRAGIQFVGVKRRQSGVFSNPGKKRIAQSEAPQPFRFHVAEQSVGRRPGFRLLRRAPVQNTGKQIIGLGSRKSYL